MRLSDDQWKGEPAFIVGGGTSLKSLDWSLLRGRGNVIAINRAFLDVPDAAVWFSEDLRVVELYHKNEWFRNFAGVKVFHSLATVLGQRALALAPDLEIVQARPGKYWPRSLSEGISSSSNSGVGAISLAWLLGADPIYLLGFDCYGQGGQEANYHKDYERAGIDRTGDHQYESFRSDFEAWVEPHVRDRSVINLTDMEKPSAIECWPRWDRDTTLKSGRPSKVIVRFTKLKTVRFDLGGVKGAKPVSKSLPEPDSRTEA